MGAIELARYRVIALVMTAEEQTLAELRDLLERAAGSEKSAASSSDGQVTGGLTPMPSLVVDSEAELLRRVDESEAQIARGEFVTAEALSRKLRAMIDERR